MLRRGLACVLVVMVTLVETDGDSWDLALLVCRIDLHHHVWITERELNIDSDVQLQKYSLLVSLNI